MIMKDAVQIPMDRTTVFNALNDPEILKLSIPGCKKLISISDTELEAIVVVKFGPVKANFNSNVELDPSAGPGQFQLCGNGDAGVAGFAKGSANVQLAEGEEGTQLSYEVNIDITGKLAQIGGRLVESTSKRLAKQFFANFEEALLDKHV